MGRAKATSGDVELDLGRYELRRAGYRIKLEKKPMELLIFLVSQRDQMVAREDIVKELWHSDLFIDTERNINNIVRKIRTALGDDSAKPRFVETVIGKGYRFIGPVRVIDAQYPRSELAHTFRSAVRQGSVGEWRGRLSLAVLPLILLGKATDDHGICLGFADSLVSLLGNVGNLDVLPTSAILNLPPAQPVSEIASRLAIRFVVHGAVQMSKGQWHLSLEMFDSSLRGPRWTRKCVLNVSHLPELEIDIAKQVAGALNRPLGPAMIQQHPRYSRDPLAYAEFMRGYRLSASSDQDRK